MSNKRYPFHLLYYLSGAISGTGNKTKMLFITKDDPIGLIPFGHLEILTSEDGGGRVAPKRCDVKDSTCCCCSEDGNSQPRDTAALKAGNGPRLIANKKISTWVLQPRGTEFCQQLEEQKRDLPWSPERNAAC